MSTLASIMITQMVVNKDSSHFKVLFLLLLPHQNFALTFTKNESIEKYQVSVTFAARLVVEVVVIVEKVLRLMILLGFQKIWKFY